MAESFSIKGVSKHTIIYGLGPIFQKSLGFLLLPVYTHYLTPADYGILELITIGITLWIMLANQGMGTAFFRYYPWDEPEKEPECVSSAYFYIITTGAALVALSFVLLYSIDSSLLRINGTNVRTLAHIAIWSAFFQIVVIVPYQKLRARMRSKTYVIVTTLGFAVNLLLNILFIAVFQLGLVGLLMGNMIAALLVALALTFSIRDDLKIRLFSTKLIKKMVKYGFPLIPGGFSYFLLSITDRLFIQSMCTTTDLGLYSLGDRIANILGVALVGPFLLVWPSIYFKWHKTKEGGVALGRVGRLFYGCLCLGALLLSVTAPVVIRTITGSQFWSAYQYVPLLLISQLGWGYFNLKNIGFNILNKTKYLPITLVAATALNIVLNYAFILKMGAMGAALATAISYLFLCILTDAWARRYYRLKLHDGRVILGLIGFLGLTYAFYELGFAQLTVINGALAAAAFTLFGGLFFSVTSLRSDEAVKVFDTLKNMVKRIGISFS